MTMNFTHIIGNPPFNQNLHLKILDKVLDVPKKSITFLHPSTLFCSPRLAFEETMHFKRHTRIFERVSDVEILSPKETNKAFGIALKNPLAISQFDATSLQKNHRTRFVKDKINVALAEKIMEKTKKDSLTRHQCTDKKFLFRCSRLHGSLCKVLASSYEIQLEANSRSYTRSYTFSFSSENERKNFYDAYMLPFFIKYQIYLWKEDMNIYARYLPWLNDYTKPWTNERLYEFFDLTDDEIKYIENKIKE